MRKIALLMAVLGATVLLQLYAAPAYATSARTFVSHTGNDNNNCLESSPCLTFAGALLNTSIGGEIDCLDAGNYASDFLITESLTIDCHGTNATTFNSSTGNGIDVDAPFGAVVVLRGLTMSAIGPNGHSGIDVAGGSSVYIEDCVITGFVWGIRDERTTGVTQLFIKNTVVRNNHTSTSSPGILLVAGPKHSVVLENVQSLGNGYGLAVAAGSNVVVSRSVISGNGMAGIVVDSGSQVFVDNTEISHNGGYGILAQGTVALANSDISFNSSSISGSTISYGNNRLFGNGPGTAPTPAGGTSTDFGQQ
jgi:hypothetical protein